MLVNHLLKRLKWFSYLRYLKLKTLCTSIDYISYLKLNEDGSKNGTLRQLFILLKY